MACTYAGCGGAVDGSECRHPRAMVSLPSCGPWEAVSVQRGSWNGWDEPRFTRETALEIAHALASVSVAYGGDRDTYDTREDATGLYVMDDVDGLAWLRIGPMYDGLYAYDGYCWESEE